MKFLIDENFPRSAVDIISAAGHEPITVDELCDLGDDDETVFTAAQSQGAVILTSDRDFYHTVPLLHPEHCGIVVISLRQPNRQAILSRLKWFFENVELPIDNEVYSLRDNSCCVKRH